MNDDSPFEDDATPRQQPGVDVDSVADPPSPDEFFLYSRIDGERTVGELCTTSGLGREKTIQGLERLCAAGLVEIPGYEPPDESGASASTPQGAEQVESDASIAEESSAAEQTSGIDLSYLPTPPEEFDYDDELLERDVPLSDALKRELICLSAQLDGLDHYQFFGVDRDASQKEIKRSYFDLSKRYHPDKHFGKEIGPFEGMLEDIFQTITRAYRTLSNPTKREEYDESLAARDAEQATPMNKPSAVRMANRAADEEEVPDAEPASPGSNKRQAAFARLVKKGERHRKRQQYLAAAEQYRKALSLHRDLNVALRAARALLRANEQIDQAVLFAKAALEIDETHTEAQMLMARALEKLGRTDAAIERYERVLELDPGHEQAQMRRKRLS